MTTKYKVFGIELSPYSVKVRSYFRYKQIPHEWVVRDQAAMPEFQKHAKLPLIPLVLGEDGRVLQDSTPIIETLEAEHPEPSIHPEDAVARFVSALVEEFGDEWGNKWMFHYRWAREEDQISGSRRIAQASMPGLEGEALDKMAAALRERMVNRVWFVGSSPETAPQIEESFRTGMARLEAHLDGRPYLFGRRPAFGDFGLWGQVYNAWTDPTPGRILNESCPHVVAWCQRMLEPKAEGDFEPWSALVPTFEPFLREQVGKLFLPWSVANAIAIAAEEEVFTVQLDGKPYTQKPQKYHAKSLAKLREKYRAAKSAELDAALESVGCLEVLQAG